MATETKIEVHRGKKAHVSILEEMERMRDVVSRRAYDLFQGSGSIFGRELDDWLAAEQETLWKPPIDFSEKEGQFEIRLAVPGVDPKDLDVQVTPECLLVKGETKHDHNEENATIHACEFESGSLFRLIEFPKRIDPEKVSARFHNGMLIFTAPVAEDENGRKVAVQAA